jgi:hypothetical protein
VQWRILLVIVAVVVVVIVPFVLLLLQLLLLTLPCCMLSLPVLHSTDAVDALLLLLLGHRTRMNIFPWLAISVNMQVQLLLCGLTLIRPCLLLLLGMMLLLLVPVLILLPMLALP